VANVLALPGLVTPQKRSFLRALDLWASSGVDFVDALGVAQMERLRIGRIASFDRDFDRFGQITGEEP
jgi:predicted nucleic acid-binding protein